MTGRRVVPGLAAATLLFVSCAASGGPQPIPDRLVALTFDDSVKSHYTVARPFLKKYGFGATFFITEGFTFRTHKMDYMTWGGGPGSSFLIPKEKSSVLRPS